MKIRLSLDFINLRTVFYGGIMCKPFKFVISVCLCMALIFGAFSSSPEPEPYIEITPKTEGYAADYSISNTVQKPEKLIEAAQKPKMEKTVKADADTPVMSEEDIELIALVTMAEAEGECEEGKRLVIDTILNRVDSGYFPDTVHGVIYQPNQFSSMWNGRVDRCEVREDICQLVREELEERTNKEVIFFTAGRYSDYGVPIFQVGNHYFSSYD